MDYRRSRNSSKKISYYKRLSPSSSHDDSDEDEEVITLDVGGIIFRTTCTTLRINRSDINTTKQRTHYCCFSTVSSSSSSAMSSPLHSSATASSDDFDGGPYDKARYNTSHADAHAPSSSTSRAFAEHRSIRMMTDTQSRNYFALRLRCEAMSRGAVGGSTWAHNEAGEEDGYPEDEPRQRKKTSKRASIRAAHVRRPIRRKRLGSKSRPLFLDRSPHVYPAVLHFLRTNQFLPDLVAHPCNHCGMGAAAAGGLSSSAVHHQLFHSSMMMSSESQRGGGGGNGSSSNQRSSLPMGLRSSPINDALLSCSPSDLTDSREHQPHQMAPEGERCGSPTTDERSERHIAAAIAAQAQAAHFAEKTGWICDELDFLGYPVPYCRQTAAWHARREQQHGGGSVLPSQLDASLSNEPSPPHGAEPGDRRQINTEGIPVAMGVRLETEIIGPLFSADRATRRRCVRVFPHLETAYQQYEECQRSNAAKVALGLAVYDLDLICDDALFRAAASTEGQRYMQRCAFHDYPSTQLQFVMTSFGRAAGLAGGGRGNNQNITQSRVMGRLTGRTRQDHGATTLSSTANSSNGGGGNAAMVSFASFLEVSFL